MRDYFPGHFPGHFRGRGAAAAVALVVLALIVAAGLMIYAFNRFNPELERGNQRERQMLGLHEPVNNRLTAPYSDADGDLIADAPKEGLRDPQTLRLSFMSAAAGIKAEQLEPMRSALEAKLGRQVQTVIFDDDKAALLALAHGQVEITAFNTGVVPRAVNVAGFVPVAAPARQGESARYRMVIITPAQSNIRKLANLQGKTIAFTSPGSNSGFKAPLVLLREQGLVPPQDYSYVFTYRHAASIEGIAAGKFDAAATASDLLEAAVERGQIKADAYRVIYESEAFPVSAFGYAHDLTPALAQAIRDALLSYAPTGATADLLSGADAMTGVNFKDDYAIARRIDDASGYRHERPAEPTPPAAAPVAGETKDQAKGDAAAP
jgi:phosphonate transport system substrate-binding protein